MKLAISIPDDTFEAAKRLALRTKKSRISDAVREYVARHAAEETTKAMDRVCAKLTPQPDEFTAAAANRILTGVKW